MAKNQKQIIIESDDIITLADIAPGEKEAWGYVRVSRFDQLLGGFSIPAQIDFIKKYCTDRGLKLTKVYKESTSARETGIRPVYDKMIKTLRKTKKSINLVYEKNDRLLRNEYDSADIINLARTTPHYIHSVREGLVLFRNAHPSTFYIFTMFSANSSIYSRNLSLEVKKGLHKAADIGYYPSKAPCGYKRGDPIPGTKGKRDIIIDPDKSGWVIRAYELYSTGLFSYKTLADKLAAEGFYYASKKVTKANIEFILTNPFYTGEFIFTGKRYISTTYTPLISKELFIKCKRVREESAGRKVQKHDFLYSGMIKCADCGCSLAGEIQKGKYIYYACHGRNCHLKRGRMLKQEHIDKCVNDILSSISVSANILSRVRSKLKEIIISHFKADAEEQSRIKKEIDKLRNRINNMYIDKLDGKISDEFYMAKSEEFQKEIDNNVLILQAKNVDTEEIMQKIDMCFELLKNAPSRYLEYNNEKKRFMLKMVVSNFIYDGQNLHVNLKSTVKAMLDSANSEKISG